MKVVIVGAGFGGIAAAIELQRSGFKDITILDAAPEIGGTWHHNTYPGAACDVPSLLYSYSFAQRKDWDRLCPMQPDILTYLRDVAHQFGVDRLVRCNQLVTRCAWDEATARWTVSTTGGPDLQCDALILATGQLHQPALPRIEGIESFAGHAFHSAQWDHDYDLRGKRVAVVGTGASAVQFVPEIAEQAARLTVFQRTGNWFMPRKNRPYPMPVHWLVRATPGLQAARRRFWFNYGESLTLMIRRPRTAGLLGRARSATFMRWQLRGHPELRKKLWPDYTFGCKRVLFSSHFLPALAREDVDLVTDAIAGMAPNGVVTADGHVHEVDCVIWGTGFRTTQFMFPMEIEGRGGRSLRDDWADGPHAHLGMTVPGYPGLFIMYGPNTNTSGGSIIWYLEQQAAYIRQALSHTRARMAAAIEVREEVEAASDREVQAGFKGTAWTRCDSWYRNPDGRVVTNWPHFMRTYGARTRTLDPAEFDLVPAPAREPAPVT